MLLRKMWNRFDVISICILRIYLLHMNAILYYWHTYFMNAISYDIEILFALHPTTWWFVCGSLVCRFVYRVDCSLVYRLNFNFFIEDSPSCLNDMFRVFKVVFNLTLKSLNKIQTLTVKHTIFQPISSNVKYYFFISYSTCSNISSSTMHYTFKVIECHCGWRSTHDVSNISLIFSPPNFATESSRGSCILPTWNPTWGLCCNLTSAGTSTHCLFNS